MASSSLHVLRHRGPYERHVEADRAALCSEAVDLSISEVVDAPNWVVSAFLPNDRF